MNRQTKRLMQRQGADRPRAPERRPQAQPQRERVGPRQYLAEVKAEMRKVAWPTRQEVINSTIVVLIAVTVLTSLIFAVDYGSAKLVLFLYG